MATRAHAGQKDRSGAPYILHPLRVMLRLNDPVAMVVAVLHDVVEDSAVTLEDLRDSGFPDDVRDAVDAMTRRTGEDYWTYIRRAGAHPVARSVKIADLQDNLERTESLPPTTENAARAERYRKALSLLTTEEG